MSKRVALQFKPDVRLSAVHASYVVATGAACNDQRTEKALVRGTSELNTRLLSSSIDVAIFWNQLLAATARGESPTESCESALLRAGCSEMQVEQTGKAISRLLSECTSAFERRFPKLSEQLELRAKPLKSRWDTCGPGLLIQIAQQIWASSPPADWWPSKVQGLLVQPIRGGDGGFDLASNRFWIEAMLTDADPSVPEVLRVAWLVTQLAVGKHLGASPNAASEDLPSDSPDVLPWALGSVPIVLAAGTELDLVHGPPPIAEALQLWRLGSPDTAVVLAQWWTQWQESRVAMPVALKALEKMLRSNRPAPAIGTMDLRDLDAD